MSKQIVSAVWSSSKTYTPGMEAELARDFSREQLEKLLAEGAITGNWFAAPVIETPVEVEPTEIPVETVEVEPTEIPVETVEVEPTAVETSKPSKSKSKK